MGVPISQPNADQPLQRTSSFSQTCCTRTRNPLCGWRDFRRSLTTEMRRNGTHPRVISDLLGHKKVNLAMDVYHRSNLKDFGLALGSVGNQLLASCDPTPRTQ